MILEIREITETSWEKTQFISMKFHGRVELVLDIILQGIIMCTETSDSAYT